MGETPVLSCRSGSDFASRLDSEIKVLAATCDARDGHLLSPDQDAEPWQQVRDAFASP